MFTIACCLVVGLGLGFDVVSCWLVDLCARVYTTFGCHCYTPLFLLIAQGRICSYVFWWWVEGTADLSELLWVWSK